MSPLLNFRISDDLNERILDRVGSERGAKSEWCRQVISEALSAGEVDASSLSPAGAESQETPGAHPSWASAEGLSDPIERLPAKMGVITEADGDGRGEAQPRPTPAVALSLEQRARQLYNQRGVTMPVARKIAREEGYR